MSIRRKGSAARLIKPLLALLAPAAGIGVAVAVAAVGSTELGGTTTAPVYAANFPVLQDLTAPGSPSYVTPDGVLTSWRYHSGATSPGTVRLELFKRGPELTYGRRWRRAIPRHSRPIRGTSSRSASR